MNTRRIKNLGKLWYEEGIRAKYIFIDGEEVVGIASDKVECALGYTFNLDALYLYLANHPNPGDW